MGGRRRRGTLKAAILMMMAAFTAGEGGGPSASFSSSEAAPLTATSAPRPMVLILRQRKTLLGSSQRSQSVNGSFSSSTTNTVATTKGDLPILQLTEWEGDSDYDLPFTMDYVIDLAVRGSSSSEYSYHPCIIDTGSANLGIALSSCHHCGGSVTSHLMVDYTGDHCIEVLYGDTEADSTYWKGYESQPVEIGFVSDAEGALTTNVRFAAITDASSGVQAFFQGGYAGILGLGYEGIAEPFYSCATPRAGLTRARPLVDSLYEAGKIAKNVFSISFCGDKAPLVVGDIDPSMYNGDIAYVKTQRTYGSFYGYYLSRVMGFSIGGVPTKASIAAFNTYGGLIVDSGTTAVMLPTNLYLDFARTLMKTVPELTEAFFLSAACVTEESLAAMPNITFTLPGDVSLTLPPRNYLIYYQDCYYWGVSPSTMAIVGNIGMQGLTVVFDRDHNRLGFAAASCSEEAGVSVGEDSSSASSASAMKATGSVLVSSPPSPSQDVEEVDETLIMDPHEIMGGQQAGSGVMRRWRSTKREAIPLLLAQLAEDRRTQPQEEGTVEGAEDQEPTITPSSATFLSPLVGTMVVAVALVLVVFWQRRRRRASYQPVMEGRGTEAVVRDGILV